MKHAFDKRLFLKLLGSLKEGFLELVCLEDTYSFGSPESGLRAMLVVHHERFFAGRFSSATSAWERLSWMATGPRPILLQSFDLQSVIIRAMENSNKLFSALKFPRRHREPSLARQHSCRQPS